jgi:hypothetical protein
MGEGAACVKAWTMTRSAKQNTAVKSSRTKLELAAAPSHSNNAPNLW